MDSVEIVVIGAGVVGLAVARALAVAGHEVLVLEREAHYGGGVSSRNSEVIHAGIYYERGSLKGRLCLRGRELLYAYCFERGLAFKRCGKLLVASSETELPKLRAIQAQAAANGVNDLQWLSQDQTLALEPQLNAVAALLSPSSGIVDSHALMTSLLGDAQNAGAMAVFNSPLLGALRSSDGWLLRTGGAQPFELQARWLINSAGLQAQAVAHSLQGLAPSAIPKRHLAKGHYFALDGRAPFSHLIYPTPVDGGLGTHLTLDMSGAARFGPDVLWLPAGQTPDDSALDYSVTDQHVARFENDIRRYWPGLPTGALHADYSGIRPKLSGPGEPAADFHISGPLQHGCAGLVQLLGIESPGLTSSLAIGEHVLALVQGAAPPPA
jgi:L-2-hydroxyglutarate oxidase LhgO